MKDKFYPLYIFLANLAFTLCSAFALAGIFNLSRFLQKPVFRYCTTGVLGIFLLLILTDINFYISRKLNADKKNLMPHIISSVIGLLATCTLVICYVKGIFF